MNRILLVDDDNLLRDALSQMLVEEGYDVFSAANGEEGIAQVKQYSPHVIILDLNMPIMGGKEFLQQIPASTTLSHSVIVLTGYGTEQDVETCYRLGIQAFVRKPVDFYELKGLINRSIQLKKYAAKLESQNRLLKSTFDCMTEGVIRMDQEFHIQMISANACITIGISAAEALGQPASTILGVTIAGPNGLLLTLSEYHETQKDIFTVILCPSGAVVPIRLSVIPLQEEQRAIGWLLLFSDLREEERLQMKQATHHAFGNMIGSTPEMKVLFELIDRVALSNTTVLIQGASGTGKELVAQEIHARSHRAQGPFQVVNCTAPSSHLMESELFGHEKGAFTGAVQAKRGRFELAHTGTLFLDEVSEIPLELQGKLLRTLQEHRFERLGGTKTLESDIRIIAATNQDLLAMVKAKKFREDLYYRLHVVNLQIPPLSERLQDIPLLVDHFIQQFNQSEKRQVTKITQAALYQMMNYSWPGNIRELYHAVEYAFAVSQGRLLEKAHLPEKIRDVPIAPAPLPLPQNEKELILQALRQTNFRKSKAASLLGIHPTTLSRKLKKFGI